MAEWICETCGVEYESAPIPPETCPICEDERQWVPPSGQRWTTREELLREHRHEVREEEPGLVGIGIEPRFGIGQRALLVQAPEGNVLWDCVALVDEEGAQRIEALGGISAIAFSHPHFFGSAVSWSRRFGDAAIWVPEADRAWFPRSAPSVRIWRDEVELAPGISLVQTGGHFPGSAVLCWAGGADGRGALLVGDTLQVVPDAGWLSIMWSYPNLIPLPPPVVDAVEDRVLGLRFDRLWGGWWDRVIASGAKEAVTRSLERYRARVLGPLPHSAPLEPPS
jgi:hypothetical protein